MTKFEGALRAEVAEKAERIAIARAEKAEAACAQMRAALERVKKTCIPRSDGKGGCIGPRCPGRVAKAALGASDVGAGWISPEQHAEVVRERDEARALAAEAVQAEESATAVARKNQATIIDRQGAELRALRAQLAVVTRERDELRVKVAASVEREAAISWEANHQRAALERHGLEDFDMGCDSIEAVREARRVRGALAEVRAQLAEVTAQAAVMREALETYLSGQDDETWRRRGCPSTPTINAMARGALASDAGRAYEERTRLLEAVAKEAKSNVETAGHTQGPREGCSCADCRLMRTLAALDAFYKEHGR